MRLFVASSLRSHSLTTHGKILARVLAAGVSLLAAIGIYYALRRPVVLSASANLDATNAYSTVIPASFFGLSVLNFSHLHPSMPFGTTRSWDAGPGLDWAESNPAPGVYNFSALDQFIAFNQAHSSEGIYTFGRTPRWASSQPDNPTSLYGPGQCAPPSHISDWDAFVTAIATHAAGRIRYWELWNEPNESTYCGDMATMVTMAQHAHQIIKRIDPTALILTPSVDKTSGPSWLSSFFASGGAHSADVIAFHGYWSARAEEIVSVVAAYRAVAAANGLSHLPIWDTESSWAYTSTIPLPSLAEQSAYIAKSYLLHWSLGVDRFSWYAYDANPPWGTLYTTRQDETPAAFAYGEIYRWMVGATMISACTQAANHIWACPLKRPGSYSAQAVWIADSSAAYTVPSQYTQYLDLAGVTHILTNRTVLIGDQPILLQSGPLPNQ